MMIGFNGGLIGAARETSFNQSVPGVWTPREQLKAKRANLWPSDPYFANVSLLLRGDGTNGSTTIVDGSLSSKTVTALGDAQISTAESKYSGSSIAFDGSGDSLALPLDNSLAFGSGEFTFEFWLFRSTSSVFTIYDTRALGQNPIAQIAISIGTNGSLDVSENAVGRLSGGSTTTGTWNHYSLVRDASNVVTGYINGSSVDTWTTSLNFVLGSAPRIASTVNNTLYLNGYIDDLRITKGVARYTSNFTPPGAL